MKRFLCLVLALMALACVMLTSASANGRIPTTCRVNNCGAKIKVVRDGSDYTVCHQETSGNAVYLVCETRHSYSTVCVKNHGYDGSYLVKNELGSAASMQHSQTYRAPC